MTARSGGRAGFILVEALAALALGGLILAALMSFTALLRRSADHAAGRVERLEVGGRAVFAIASEIRQARRLRWAAEPAARLLAAGGPKPANAPPQPPDGRRSPVPRMMTPTQGGQAQSPDGQGQGQGPAEAQRPFVFSGRPDRVFFALAPEQANGLRAQVLVAYQIDPSGVVLRAEAELPVTATGPGAVQLGPVARIDPGRERLRFAFVDRKSGSETILDEWDDTERMPVAVRIDRVDAASGEPIGSLRVPLLVEAEPGCVDPGKAFCSLADRTRSGAPEGGAPAPGAPNPQTPDGSR